MLQFFHIMLLKRRRQRLVDDIDHLRGVEQFGRRKLAETILTIRHRETKIGRIDRELMQIESPHRLTQHATK